MSILINKNTRVITQGITGKTGQFHTEKCQEYANGKNCFVAGVNPKKAGESIFGIPIYASVKEASSQTGATVSVIYVPPAGASPKAFRCVTCWKCATKCAPKSPLGARKPFCSGPTARG
jgi:succinyl-CoA synthetase alpha subunit